MLGLEIRKPDKETVFGFVLAWVCVLVIMGLTMVLANIGA
jgi:hypothetical protein